ncbi:transglutaminase-like putative cysteine protease [Jatrophihabitans sp. GAS493]|uniref:transglutaminase family protein n=1 Tax=Jatrophihabitans sp. GAS493 TaxID=1907575 RepID=UPI000BB7DD8C|nr:transglutaminase family protein [Jatrophihabitans sp. GAS493]SOD73410.1 transglutaminase-like putative cysteine protease [Jatrophihabitans sp. GAS493]
MRYSLTHTTTYTYDDEVTASYGRAHLLPHDLTGQAVLSADLVVSPEPAETREHVDFFGNRSSYFVVREAHTILNVTSRCVLEISRPAVDVTTLNGVSWEQARDGLAGNDPARQYLLPSRQIATAGDVSQYAGAIFTPGRPFGEAIADLTSRIYHDFKYKSGSTTVRSTLTEVLANRSGVCQDFAHLAVGCLRSVGLAARYVSGYLETVPPPGKQKLQGADASHAWASVLLPGSGWVDIDPTNNQFVDHRYLILAHGRDYSDVPPLKGVIMTDAKNSSMRVSVDVTPLG